MQIFIMRHGEAENRFIDDASRCLTPLGVSEAGSSGTWLRDVVGHVDMALVSPYVRALQTLDALMLKVPVELTQNSADVTPDGQPELFHDYLRVLLAENPHVRNLLIVSHMPFVSSLVDELCGHYHSVLFATAGIVQLDYDLEAGRASLIRQYIP